MTDIYSLASYYYDLPQENIAQSPANPRDMSKLLVWDVASDTIDTDRHFRDITGFLRPDDLLILNNTRVIPARLTGTRKGGGKCEIFLLRNLSQDFLTWEALTRPARKIHAGDIITLDGVDAKILEERLEGIRTITFNLPGHDEFMTFLQKAGQVPLPPYIHNDNDMRAAYQTVFARHDGSVAAPTASLHFTQELLAKIQAMGVTIGYVTLHVGLGTFRPVKTQDIREHTIHTEHCEIPEATAKLIRECKGRVIASGTTAARTLEALEGKAGNIDTGLYIYPGYKFKIVDALITNFHLPESSLLMLVAAFAAHKAGGHEQAMLARLLEIYTYCAENHWRFFSFGDAMFIT